MISMLSRLVDTLAWRKWRLLRLAIADTAFSRLWGAGDTGGPGGDKGVAEEPKSEEAEAGSVRDKRADGGRGLRATGRGVSSWASQSVGAAVPPKSRATSLILVLWRLEWRVSILLRRGLGAALAERVRESEREWVRECVRRCESRLDAGRDTRRDAVLGDMGGSRTAELRWEREMEEVREWPRAWRALPAADAGAGAGAGAGGGTGTGAETEPDWASG